MLKTKPSAGRSVNRPSMQALVANLNLLYMKAKNYHWNVSGPQFYGLHKTFDGIAEVAVDWIDTIGERTRAMELSVCGCAEAYLSDAWFKEGDYKASPEVMVTDMVSTLKTISDRLNKCITNKDFDEVTLNIFAELAAALDKQCYFVNSSK